MGKGAFVQVLTPLRDDRGKASKVEMNEKLEVQNSAVADAKIEVQIAMDKAASDAGSPYEKWRKENKKKLKWKIRWLKLFQSRVLNQM